MATDDDAGSSAERPPTQPVFSVPQADGIDVALDFTTPGPFGDFAFTARIPEPDGTVRERVYGAHHTDEAAIFVEILQHWARVAEPDDILAGLERAAAVLRFLTNDLEPTARSQNDFSDLLHRGIEPLRAMNFLPADHEHSDERGDSIALSPRRTDLVWKSQRDPRTAFSVPPSHLWVFVTGMMWRSYDHDSLPLSRLNTTAYETAIATFRRVIHRRSEAQLEASATAACESPDEDVMATPELVAELCDLLGARLVAYLSSAPATQTVRAWADPTDPRSPPEDVLDRLRLAHQAASLLGQKDSATVVQAWFQGRNPYLDDFAPARVLRESGTTIASTSVLAAARAFAACPESTRPDEERRG
ncbi:hypothetical protein [Nocardioides sp. REDSEA-S30_B4]|jgi:hypothetical protein|uniref:hypothetical protein n=1 Tax=Nocardioides sp. REDSEA-S30_B4 TaxID=1811552 RepID=UPI000AB88B95|nr:hypothetical protein [Nocardioides sp. REDSEA-S30_B4]